MEIKSITQHLKGMKRDKKGMSIGDIYPVVLTITLVAILLAIAMFVLGEFGDQMTNNSAEQNATDDIISDFTDFVPWIGIILLVIAAAIVLGVLVRSFSGTGRV